MEFYNENKILIQNLCEIKKQTTEMEEFYKNNFALLMTTTVRNKLFSNFIKIFKLIIDEDIISCRRLMPRIYKQISIHKMQLRKVENKCNNELNTNYLDDIVKIILTKI
jgi:hypothetical protein